MKIVQKGVPSAILSDIPAGTAFRLSASATKLNMCAKLKGLYMRLYDEPGISQAETGVPIADLDAGMLLFLAPNLEVIPIQCEVVEYN